MVSGRRQVKKVTLVRNITVTLICPALVAALSEVTSPADDYTVRFPAFSKPQGDPGTRDLLHSSYSELEKLRRKRQQHLQSHAGRAERQIQPDDKPLLPSDSVVSSNNCLGQYREGGNTGHQLQR